MASNFNPTHMEQKPMTHPKILEQIESDGFQDAPDSQTFAAHQNAKFVLSDAQNRILALQNLDTLIAQDDGTSLRAKAELWTLKRGLSATHQAMLKVGR